MSCAPGRSEWRCTSVSLASCESESRINQFITARLVLITCSIYIVGCAMISSMDRSSNATYAQRLISCLIRIPGISIRLQIRVKEAGNQES